MRVECMISLWEKKQKLIHCLFVLLLVVWVFKSRAIYEKGSILTIPSLQFMWKQSLQSFKSQNIESNFYQQRLCSANSSCWHWSKAWYTILFRCASAHHHHHVIIIITSSPSSWESGSPRSCLSYYIWLDLTQALERQPLPNIAEHTNRAIKCEEPLKWQRLIKR